VEEASCRRPQNFFKMLSDRIVVHSGKAKQSVHAGPRNILELTPDHLTKLFRETFEELMKPCFWYMLR